MRRGRARREEEDYRPASSVKARKYTPHPRTLGRNPLNIWYGMTSAPWAKGDALSEGNSHTLQAPEVG